MLYAVNSNYPVVSSIRHNPIKFFNQPNLTLDTWVMRHCTGQATKQQLSEQYGDNLWSTQTPGVQKHPRTAAKLAQQKKYTSMPGRDNLQTVATDRQHKITQHFLTASVQKKQWQRLWKALEFNHKWQTPGTCGHNALHTVKQRNKAETTPWCWATVSSDTWAREALHKSINRIKQPFTWNTETKTKGEGNTEVW